MRAMSICLLVALMALGFAVDNEEPLRAQAVEQVVATAYYPGVATYTPDKIVGAVDATALDTPYQPQPRRTQVQYANYAQYAGNYATGERQVWYQQGCNSCSGGCGDDYGYFGDGGWYPGRGVRRWVANGGWFPGRGVLRCLFGRR